MANFFSFDSLQFPVGFVPEEWFLQTAANRMNTINAMLQTSEDMKKNADELALLLRGLRERLSPSLDNRLQKVPRKRDLINMIICGNKNYQFKLKLDSSFPKCVSKSMFFDFHVTVKAYNGESLAENSEILLKVEIWSAECPPKRLFNNKSGRDLIINDTCNLKFYSRRKKHLAFFKVKITEVTSHFMNGWVFLLITADSRDLSQLFQPLVIKHVYVQSKRELKCYDDSD
ncbi:unnamed protein product [Blepharisma stoltei]|uniref:Uncharacterized protein n=1 Tax=Blepharisma stoltei TaxID=1481888 RepID=A0AAU9K0U8_9CILI|nr:unnamed protein product [Blepharisma stoltei]